MFQTHKEVLNYDQCFNIKENRFIRRRRPVRNSGSESTLKQGRKEGIYELHGSCSARERLRDEDSNDDTGKCEAEQINEKRAAEEAAAVQADESGTEDNGAEAGSAETV